MLEGKLGDFSLPDIFQLITLTKKSGALRLISDQQEGRILFRGGEVCFAVADVRRLAMGARLVAAGLVDEDQLMKVLEAQKSGGTGNVLQALLAEAVVDEDALDAFVREQIEDAVFDLMRVDEAAFSFDAAEDPDATVGLTVSTEHLIIEGGRRLGEWAAIRDQIPSSDAVLELSPAAGTGDEPVSIPAEQWRVMALVDGKRTVAEIVDLHGQGEFATSKVLCDLVSAGLVEVTDPASGSSGALSKLVERRDLLRRLEEIELGAPAPTARPEPPEPEPSEPASAVEPVAEEPSDVIPPAEPADRPEPVVAPPVNEPVVEPAVAEPVIEEPAVEEPAVEAPGDEQAEEAPKSAEVPQVPEPTAMAEPAPEIPAEEPTPVEESQPVDRGQVARELASLGLDDLAASPAKAAANGSASANGSSNGNAANGSTPAEPAEAAAEIRKLTRDEDVNKGLLLRLIDGVKGA